MNDNDFYAAINLLDDPDVAQIVEQHLFEQGDKVIEQFRKISSQNIVINNQNKLEKIIERINFSTIINRIKIWLTDSSDLLKGAWLVSQIKYPTIDFNTIKKQMADIYNAVSAEYITNLSPLEKIKVMNYIFYKKLNFSGNDYEMHNPYNSLINKVFENKKGNTITMAIVYALMLQKIGLPVCCVNMPKNFLLAYTAKEYNRPNEILFYINPYNNGAVFGRKDVEQFLKAQKIKPQDEYFAPCDNITTIQRLVNGLKFAYNYIEETESYKQMEEVEQVFPTKLSQSIEWN